MQMSLDIDNANINITNKKKNSKGDTLVPDSGEDSIGQSPNGYGAIDFTPSANNQDRAERRK